MKNNLIGKAHAGFSLLEAVVAMSITVVALIALSSFQRDIFYFNNVLSEGFTSQAEARRALKSLTEEIRIASLASNGAYPISSATATSFSFYSDIDADGLKERIRYFVSGTTLRKGVIIPTGSPLAYVAGNEVTYDVVHYLTNGTGSIFQYYDSSYDGTSGPLTQPVTVTSIRLVKITIDIDKNPITPPGPATLTTQVSIRNIKDNL